MVARLAERVILRTFDGRPGPETSPDAGWRRSLVPAHVTFRQAVALVQATGIVMLVDADQRLVGTITDADIRRALLRGARDDDPARVVLSLAASATVTGSESGRDDEREPAASAPRPIVDEGWRVVGVQPEVAPQLADRLVVIMAGGVGARLRPLTDRCPKPLVHVGGRPLLERTIERLHDQGFRRILLCVGYRANMIERHFGDGLRFGVRLGYINDEAPLGTAGPLGLIEHRPEAGFLVINGDIVTAVDFGRLIAFHDRSDAAATMCVCEAELQTPYGIVQIQDDGVDTIAEKPTRRCFINSGIYALEPRVLDLVPRRVRFDMPTLFNALIRQKQRIAAFPLYEDWIDVGNQRDLVQANAQLAESDRRRAARPDDSSAETAADLGYGLELVVEDL